MTDIESKYLIYGLLDPTIRELRYVGKSSTGMERPERHWKDPSTKRLDDYCHRWVRSLGDSIPEIVILQEIEPGRDVRDRLNSAEIYWIKIFKELGANLTNMTPGGDGVVSPMPDDIRKKISETRKAGNYVSWSKTHEYSAEAKAKMRTAKLGKTLTLEHRAKISASGKGRIQSPETRAKISATRKLRYGISTKI